MVVLHFCLSHFFARDISLRVDVDAQNIVHAVKVSFNGDRLLQVGSGEYTAPRGDIEAENSVDLSLDGSEDTLHDVGVTHFIRMDSYIIGVDIKVLAKLKSVLICEELNGCSNWSH